MRFLNYIGGKSRLAKTIIDHFPPHTCYCEVFGGGGHILLNKKPSSVEVFNDINKELITLYRVIQNHLPEFLRCIQYIPISRDEFYRQKALNPEHLTDIQRAIRFYYLQRSCYGGRLRAQSFGYKTCRSNNYNPLALPDELDAVCRRLARVYIECLPYAEILARYDAPHTLFYLDPPYYENENNYGKGIFTRADFGNIADILTGIKGKFILSLNDKPQVRDIFKDFYIKPVKTTYTANNKHQTPANEVLILNVNPQVNCTQKKEDVLFNSLINIENFTAIERGIER